MKKIILILIIISGLSCSLPLRKFRKMDTNHDGFITKEEFKGPMKIFNLLDENQDGKISENEIKKAKFRKFYNIYLSEKVEIIKDVIYGEVDGKKLLLDIVKPKKIPESPMPVIVFVHGGGWKRGDKRGGILGLIPFAEKGYFCVSINYRLSYEAKFPAQIEDCKCAIRFLKANSKKYNIDSEKIGMWGTSAGGHLVSLLGTTGYIEEFNKSGGWEGYSSKVSAVCDWFGPTDFLSIRENSSNPSILLLLGGKIGEKRELAKQASPVYYVSENCPPFLIMHGEKDPLVPFSQSEILFKTLKGKKVETTLIKIKNAGHGIGFGEKAVEYVEAFFDYHLKGEKEKWEKLAGNRNYIEIE